MPHIYTLRHTVFNSEGDAWGQLQPSGVLRILETAAILAAAAGGYGDEFHAAQGTAWVIRRMNLCNARTRSRQRGVGDQDLGLCTLCACEAAANITYRT